MPKVTVIVPNYNHAPFLRQRIDTILNQSFQDFELIILDDCSTDNSQEIIESYRHNPHVTHVIYNEVNGGTPFKQWNKGIRLAKGEWIWIAESDDFADEHFLESLLCSAQTYEDVGFAFAWTYYVNAESQVIGRNGDLDCSNTNPVVHKSKDFIRKRVFIRETIDNVSECIFKKGLFVPSNTTMYDNMKLCGDWFFYVLLIEQTDVLELKTPLSYYRKHSYNTVIKTEHEGRTFLEGMSVYNYITTNILHPNQHDFKEMAKYWIENRKIYDYSDETNKNVRALFLKNYPMVVFYYYVVPLWRKIKSIIKLQ